MIQVNCVAVQQHDFCTNVVLNFQKMDTIEVKKSVVEGYSQLAKASKGGLISKLFGCCNTGENAVTVGKAIGYSQAELELAPEGANLGVGCGNPSAHAAIKPGQTVVDLGSGAGCDAFIIAKSVGKTGKVVGVDLSTEMISLARRNARKGRYGNVEFLHGDIEQLPIKDNIADWVVSNCVINLSERKDLVYREAFRVLREGGKISVSDIVLERELPEFIKKSLAGRVACVSGAEKLSDYLRYVQDAGFKNINVESKGHFPLELIISDPQLAQIAQELNFNINSDEVKDIASRVASISLTAEK